MTPLEAAASGVVQGLTEFLPISSSGHLVLLHHFFGMKPPQLFFDLILHLGTTLAIVITFWRDLCLLLAKEKRSLGLIGVGFFTTCLMGVALADPIESIFQKPRLVSVGFLVTACWLWLAMRRQGGVQPLNVWRSFLIGVSQGVAMAPGISRSGATIATALLLGVAPEEALRFSFFLAIPTIGTAFAYEALAHPITIEWAEGSVLIGFLTSVAVGLFAIQTLRLFLRRRRLHLFSLYLVGLGLAGLIYFK